MGVRMDCTRQNLAFDIAAKAYVIVRALGAGDAHDILFNDWVFIQISGNIMTGRADQLHPAFVCLLVGVGTFEAPAGTSGGY